MPTWTPEQSDAIEKNGTNIIVSAGAGSGKTAVLTARVLKKLEQGIHINELLILTFTKAAAGEMKERIRKNILKNPNLKKELSLLDTAYITTFDAFSLSIVKKYHYLLKITSNPEITNESILEILRKDTMRKILDSFYEKKDSDFTKMIEDYCVKDDDEIYNALLTIAKKLENNFTKKELLEEYIVQFYQEQHIDKIIEEFENFILQKRNEIKEKIEELSYIAPKDYLEKCYENLSGLLNASDIDTLISYRSCKMPSLPKNMDESVKEKKEEVVASLKEVLRLLDYGTKSKLKEDLYRMKPTINTFCTILKEYFENFEAIKKEKGYYDFNDIATLALNLLKQYPNVCEELKDSFQEIMIDEYQDTNDLQETFISMISNHNVYMVGDIKQSIYRFRNANPYLFKKKYDQYREHIDGEKIDLLKNFRSREEVLSNINQIFNLIMDDDLGGANYLEEHQMVFGNTNYVINGSTKENYQMEILTYPQKNELGFTKEEIEIFTIGRDIEKKIKEGYLLFDKDKNEIHRAEYKDFVILMDRSSNFNLYKKILNYLNIPISIYKEETLNDSTCFFVIKNVIHLINSYKNKTFDKKFEYAFTSIARSFLFEYQDELIYQILQNHTWYQNSIYKQLEPLIESLTTKNLSEIVEEIYNKTQIYEKLILIGNIKENMTILAHLKELAKTYGNQGYNCEDFCEFLNRINKEEMPIKFSTNDQEENSVKLMTIHKSKGLEYPICYFSGLYKAFNISDIKERFLFDSHYGFVVPLKNEGIATCFLKELVKQNYIKEEIGEKIRLFYVAVTRAKEKMIFILPNSQKNEKYLTISKRLQCKTLADFLYNIWGQLKNFQKEIDIASLDISKDYLLETQSEELKLEQEEPIKVQELNIPIEQKEEQKFSKVNMGLYTNTEYKNIKLGIKMHEYLECIDFKNPNYELIPESFLREKVKKFITSSFLQENINGNFKKEYEFIYEENQKEYHGIIDLLIELPNKMIILDYKLNNLVDKAYLSQLQGYQKYIESKTEKEVEIYLYSILSEEFVMLENNKLQYT